MSTVNSGNLFRFLLCFLAERKTSLGKNWHPNCLRCEECEKILTPGQHAEVKIKTGPFNESRLNILHMMHPEIALNSSLIMCGQCCPESDIMHNAVQFIFSHEHFCNLQGHN